MQKTLESQSCPFLKKHVCIDFRKRGKKKEREGNTNRLPPACPVLGIEPAAQAHALTGNRISDLLCWDGAQSTEPHWPDHLVHF